MSKPLAAAIYEEQLISPTEGFPLWEPNPGSNQPAVEIADVGYVSSGGWIRLFNASRPCGDPSNDLGVPNGYQQLVVGTLQERASLPAKVPIFSETVEQRGLETALIGAPGAPIQVGGGFSFKCSRERGAVLVLGDDAERRDALRKQAFARLIVEQSTNWLTFANDIHERGITLDDLVLVTGCDKTSSWACAAFSKESTEASICFSAGQAGIVESNLSISWIWSNCSSVSMRSGPARPSTQQHIDPASISDVEGGAVDTHMQPTISATPESRPLIRDQCVFLRGYKVLDRKTWRNRLKLLVRKDIYDGFDYLRKNKDRTRGPDSGPSGRLDSHFSQGMSGNFQGSSYGGERSSVITSSGGGISVERDGSSPGASDLLESESSNSGSDDGLPLTTALNQPKNSNHLDVILEYILQNSSAELALAHHDDLSYLLQLFGSATEFADRFSDYSPIIFIENGVGMLEKTSYCVNPSLLFDIKSMEMKNLNLGVIDMELDANPPVDSSPAPTWEEASSLKDNHDFNNTPGRVPFVHSSNTFSMVSKPLVDDSKKHRDGPIPLLCRNCNRLFFRKDHRDSHQRICSAFRKRIL